MEKLFQKEIQTGQNGYETQFKVTWIFYMCLVIIMANGRKKNCTIKGSVDSSSCELSFVVSWESKQQGQSVGGDMFPRTRAKPVTLDNM